MMLQRQTNEDQSLPLELVLPEPNRLYSLEVTVLLTGVPRRSILVYSRWRLVQPVFQAPYGVMAFSDEAIQLIRQIDYLRRGEAINLSLLRQIMELLAEVKRLRTQVRSLRQR